MEKNSVKKITDIEVVRKLLLPQRLEILRYVRALSPDKTFVKEIAQTMGIDYKNCHTHVRFLSDAGLLKWNRIDRFNTEISAPVFDQVQWTDPDTGCSVLIDLPGDREG